MKNILAKIWVPLLLVSMAAVQSFGVDAGRAVGLKRLADSLILSQLHDTTYISDSILPATPALDSIAIDSVAADTASRDTILLVLSARDTIRIPDSLQYTDPLKYKYYIAIKDSTTRFQVRDSLIAAGDTLELALLDSLYLKDSSDVAQARFEAWYASLSRMERKKYDAQQKLPALIAAANRKMEIKDSIKAYKDSVRQSIPRILDTYAIPDSLHFKRIITWKMDPDFQDLNGVRDMAADTSYNTNFYDYNFFREDINATWLGVSGSATQLYDFFARKDEANAIFYTPYRIWSYSPDELPQYNTKTPYTELAYYGTLFANQEKEEANIKVLTTQNITPALNLTLEFKRYGGNGMLKREDTANKTFAAYTNYLGKKYMMHAGYIYNKVARSENGGIIDEMWIRDTTVDAREIDVYLRDAGNEMKRNTIFLDQTYRIPFSFLKDLKGRKERKREEFVRDSIMASGDSVAIAAIMEAEKAKMEADAAQADTLKAADADVTTAFIGHSSEYSVFRKTYTDNISTSASDTSARRFYNDRFYINPTRSMDSLRVMRFDNKVFIRLQPWKNDGIISRLDVGLGDKLVNYYSFRPVNYIEGSSNVVQNSVYLYAGANGQYKNYLRWDAKGRYNFLGYEINDFSIEANAVMNFYPFRRARKSPLSLGLHFETSLKEPDYYQEHLFTNHFKWDNDFSKISTTRAEASLSIPRWDMAASFGYALLSNNIYYDNTGIVRQNTAPMSVMTAKIKKNFQIWKFHLDHQAMLQLSSAQDVLPLPLVSLHFRYYLQFDVVKGAMQMQIGADGTYNTKWYAPAYNPVLGVFHNQNVREYGNCPYIDAFVNIQWKKASIFIKYINVNMGWPNKSADYFSAAGYIAPQRAVKFGITWPFWVRPGKGSTSASGTSTAGGGRSSAGSAGGRMPSGGGMQSFRR
ncbi:MAG: putative porin [Bacteroidales bacterium]|nr:putative porin [Bacteroidales bacterium]